MNLSQDMLNKAFCILEQMLETEGVNIKAMKTGNCLHIILPSNTTLTLHASEVRLLASKFDDQLETRLFKIGDNIWMSGCSRKDSIHGNQLTVYELFNMTEEMETGQSTSIFITDIKGLPKPSLQETILVSTYLNTLNK